VEELIQIISYNILNNQAVKNWWNELYGPEEEGNHPTAILKDPLSRSDIAALETRLNISLPDDYKEFLATTNGLGASWDGITEGPPLFPASEVRWISEEEE